jgi:hypothetical protein
MRLHSAVLYLQLPLRQPELRQLAALLPHLLDTPIAHKVPGGGHRQPPG